MVPISDRLRRLFLSSLALLTCLFLPAHASAGVLHGKVVAIADGDTITVLYSSKTRLRVRLAGIVAPDRDQAFGTKSREHLVNLVYGKQIKVEYSKLGHYGRIVGKVIVDGRDVGLEQIKAGFARHSKQDENEQSAEDREAYAKAEQEARASKRGLWADVRP